MVQILAVQIPEQGTDESHIAAVRWYNPADGKMNVATVAVMVEWIRNNGVAYTYDGESRGEVEVVDADPPYIKMRDQSRAGSLLHLPRFT